MFPVCNGCVCAVDEYLYGGGGQRRTDRLRKEKETVIWARPERAKQLLEFDGLEYKGGTPTDIDCMFEHKNRAYVIMELKSHHTPVPKGQKMCLERMADDFAKAGKKAMVIVGEHYESPDKNVTVATCTVREIYYNGNWYKGRGENVRERMFSFLRYADRGKDDDRRTVH